MLRGKLKDYCRTEGVGILISRIQKITLEKGLRIAYQIDKPQERPRRTHWEIIGFIGNWLLVHTFISQNRPSQPDKDSRYHFLNRTTLIEEDSVVKSSISLTEHAGLEVLYVKRNVGIFDDSQSRIIIIDKRPIRLTPEGQSTLRVFAEIDDFSYCYQGDGSMEIKIAGQTAKNEKVFIESSAHPFIPMTSLASSAPDHFPQMDSVVPASSFNPFSPGAALAVIPPVHIAPPPVLHRNSTFVVWSLVVITILGLIVMIRKVLNAMSNRVNRA